MLTVEGKETRDGENPEYLRNTALIPTRRKHGFVARTMEEPRARDFTQKETLMRRKSALKAGSEGLSRIRQKG